MPKAAGRFFLVREDLLPASILKTALAKELLDRGEAATVAQAVEKVGVSRSAFYKYRDGVFTFDRFSTGEAVTLALVLEHRSGVLSGVLSELAAAGANIITIHQDVPVYGLAGATVTFDASRIDAGLDRLVWRLRELDGVKKADLVGQGWLSGQYSGR